MIAVGYVRRMARYNRWQNQNLYGAADGLSDGERRRERGAFFGSIHATLNHLLWGDRTWLSRFTDVPRPAGGIPESVALHPDWDGLKAARAAFDETIVAWADRLDPAWLEGDLAWYSGAAKREMSAPKWVLVAHLFNHGTHHRGQVHCMLTQAGARPGPTDLPWMPADV
ncbi:MAG TPA: DinB family protein [Beijerinckiaceae bacterium]|nr:DinB family protein [Beijerinckiaceae bacterium]